MIGLMVNGERRSVADGILLADALALWGYGCGQIAVAVNGEFVARAEYGGRRLRNGDCLDVVAPVQGG